MPEIYTWDIEANNLLNEETVDYNASPYVLKDSFNMHCIVLEKHSTGEFIAFYDGDTYILDGRRYEESDGDYDYILEDYDPVEYTHYQLSEFREYIRKNPMDRVVAHNGINYDHLVCKMHFGMDYTVGPDSWDGKDLTIEDTMVTSKCLNPDRFGGHSLDNLGKRVGLNKIEFRKSIPQKFRFRTFAADMLFYCIRDVAVNTKVYYYLEEEKLQDNWGTKWDDAIDLEKAVAELITRQEHRGFKFDKKLAEESVRELDAMMEERRRRVEPLLPPRPATQAFLKVHTPAATHISEVVVHLPSRKFKANGEASQDLIKWCEKHNGEYCEDSRTITAYGKEFTAPFEDGKVVVTAQRTITTHMRNWMIRHGAKPNKDFTKYKVYGKVFPFILPDDPEEVRVAKRQPVLTEMVATIDDTTFIKDWLCGLGWNPSEYKDKDISVKSGPAKQKRTPEELEVAVEAYVEETMSSNFKSDRMQHFSINNENRHTLKRKILKQAQRRSCKVLTNPSFTVGQDKEMCRDLERISKQFPYAKDVVEYLTFKHRRNSILGGGLEWEDGEESAEKGYIANLREDGRIATPADTCGAATSRFKHRVVVNVPRPTSLYGEKLRALFGVDETCFQVGYDFDSLEARIEAHYCYKYDDKSKGYCNSLILPKPNDVHTKTAVKISETLGRKFERSPAKNVKYGITYGSQAAKVAKTIGSDLKTGQAVFDAFWEAALPLKKLKDALAKYWKDVGNKKFILGIDGRKVPTRAEHAILNSLFQSGGVICAKRAMVIHDRLLKKEGLLVDFFTDDWKNKEHCQQLIAMHDESQLEVARSLVKFKRFDTKEDAEIYKATSDKVWSDVTEAVGGGYFIAYSRAGELAAEAVAKTTDYYKLNIDLTAGYMLGRNWKQCH